jgi:uncharacterized membrane protein
VNSTIVSLLVIMMVPIFIPLIFIPFWTRKTDSFGVSIPEEAYHRPDIKKMRKKYAWVTGMLALITAAVFWISTSGHDENLISTIFGIFILVYIMVSFLVYLIFHRQMKELKSKNPEWTAMPQLVMVDTGFRYKKLVYSNIWFVIPFLISILTIIITLTNYQ